VGEPYDVARDSVVHAQFNAAYSFARALSDGRVDLKTYQKPAISDPRIVALTRVTKVMSDPAIDATAIEPARVKVTLKSGRVLEASSDTIKGSPEQPMSGQEVTAKFRACLEFGLGASAAQADRLADTVANLENVDDAGRAIVESFPS
jgi:2-methylcitrate dehydratase PrpD